MSFPLAWGCIAGSSLVLGGLLALNLTISRRTLGYIMAFGSGVLVSAIAYELVEEAIGRAAGGPVALGLFAGAITFYVTDLLLDRLGGAGRKGFHRGQTRRKPLSLVVWDLPCGV